MEKRRKPTNANALCSATCNLLAFREAPMRMMTLAAVLALAACGSQSVKETFSTTADGQRVLASVEYEGGSPDYALYVHAVSRQSAPTPVADPAAACNGDPTCVVAVNALANAGRSNPPPVIQPPAPKRTFGDRLEGTIAKLAPWLVQGYGSYNSTKVALGQQAMVSGIVATSGAVAQAAVEHAQPSITVGGDYVSGTQHTGDNVTGDGNATRGGQVGHTIDGNGNATDGSQVGHNIDSGALVEDSTDVQIEQGPGDQLSPPTTIDNSNDGDDCTGEQCQGQPPPPDPTDPPPQPNGTGG